MDEASSLIAELQQKLAQLDHKIWLYRQDMASEFKKYADNLLRDVPGDVSDTVNKAIAESLRSYPSLDVGAQVVDSAVNNETAGVRADGSLNIEAGAAPIALPDQGLKSPAEVPRNTHEREQEFQGLFTPSYLPLLDSTDRNERRPNSMPSSPVSESKAISILARERATESTSPTSSSSAPSSSSLSLRQPPTPPRRRNTDEASTNSDQSDTPVRRSALRRSPNSTKQPQSPRHVRFEFAGEEFPTTSSPKLESPALEHVGKVPIILGNGEDTDYGTAALEEDEIPESPPRKRVTSSEALRLLSRGPIDDDGTQWTEVRAPPDGSASVPNVDGESDDSEDGDSLCMRPMTVREAAARSNGHGPRSLSPKTTSMTDNHQDPEAEGSQVTKNAEMRGDDDDSKLDVAEEEAALADLAPLQSMKAHTPVTTISAAELQSIYVDKSKTVATNPSRKPWFVLDDGTDLKDLPESKVKLEVKDYDDDDDDDDLFDFDEAGGRPRKYPDPEPDSEPESPGLDTAEEPLGSISKYATSPARGILKSGTPSHSSSTAATTTSTDKNTVTTAAPSSHRSSYHPFNTPIVSEAIHAQAASLGHIQSFVGSVKNGLDEDVLQSFRLGVDAGVGSLRGGAPRSLSEKMAFDDAMEAAAAAAARERDGDGRKR